MSWTNLKAAIAAVIKTNNNQEITGAVLQNTLISIVNSVGANATFAGVATPSTSPGTPDGPVFWLASQSGQYPNFNNLTVADGIGVFLWNANNSQWSLNTIVTSSFITNQNITTDTSASICSNDFNNLPNNKIYGLGIASNTTIANTPVGNSGGRLIGQVITFGKTAERTSSDSQKVIIHNADDTINIYERDYMAGTWSGWVKTNGSGNDDAFVFIEDDIRNDLIGTSKLASHVNIPSICLIGTNLVTDMPDNSKNWILKTLRYSTNYNLQEAIGFDEAIRGNRYIRVVHRTNYNVFFNWKAISADGLTTNQNITTDTSASICSNDFNNLPNNKIYGLGIVSNTTIANTPVGNSGGRLIGQVITFGKSAERTSSDSQKVIIHNADDTINIYERDYMAGIWSKWTKVSGNDLKILAVGDSIVRGYRNSNKSFIAYLTNNYKNISISGATISSAYTDIKNIPQQLVDETSYQPDIIIANGGTNDYYRSLALGSIPSSPVTTDAEANALNRNTVYGGLQYLFYNMIKKYPSAQRFFVMVHKMLNWAWTQNGAGYTFAQLADGIHQICNLYGVVYVDVFNKSLINTAFSQYKATTTYEEATDKNAWNAQNYVDKDGIHPADMGYRIGYVPIVIEAIKYGTNK